MTSRQPLTAARTREIAAESGLAHAEFCVEQDESQFGREALAEARAELAKIEAEGAAE